MSREFDNILTEGLLQGYVGNTTRQKVDRGGFRVTTSHYEGQEGKYHDEWIAGDLTGGGQEIVINGKRCTRLYGGGVVDEKKLEKLGLTLDEVVGKKGALKKFIGDLGDKTRLAQPVKAKNGLWRYEYKIINGRLEIKTLVTREEIHFDGNFVFAHFFIITEIV